MELTWIFLSAFMTLNFCTVRSVVLVRRSNAIRLDFEPASIVPVGTKVTLTCDAIGQLGEVTWFRDGIQTRLSSSKYDIIVTNSSAGQYHCTLQSNASSVVESNSVSVKIGTVDSTKCRQDHQLQTDCGKVCTCGDDLISCGKVCVCAESEHLPCFCEPGYVRDSVNGLCQAEASAVDAWAPRPIWDMLFSLPTAALATATSPVSASSCPIAHSTRDHDWCQLTCSCTDVANQNCPNVCIQQTEFGNEPKPCLCKPGYFEDIFTVVCRPLSDCSAVPIMMLITFTPHTIFLCPPGPPVMLAAPKPGCHYEDVYDSDNCVIGSNHVCSNLDIPTTPTIPFCGPPPTVNPLFVPPFGCVYDTIYDNNQCPIRLELVCPEQEPLTLPQMLFGLPTAALATTTFPVLSVSNCPDPHTTRDHDWCQLTCSCTDVANQNCPNVCIQQTEFGNEPKPCLCKPGYFEDIFTVLCRPLSDCSAVPIMTLITFTPNTIFFCPPGPPVLLAAPKPGCHYEDVYDSDNCVIGSNHVCSNLGIPTTPTMLLLCPPGPPVMLAAPKPGCHYEDVYDSDNCVIGSNHVCSNLDILTTPTIPLCGPPPTVNPFFIPPFGCVYDTIYDNNQCPIRLELICPEQESLTLPQKECPHNEKPVACFACDRTCFDGDSPLVCPDICPYSGGTCACADGLVRDTWMTGLCIDASDCPQNPDSDCPNEHRTRDHDWCQLACSCSDLWEGNCVDVCIPPESRTELKPCLCESGFFEDTEATVCRPTYECSITTAAQAIDISFPTPYPAECPTPPNKPTAWNPGCHFEDIYSTVTQCVIGFHQICPNIEITCPHNEKPVSCFACDRTCDDGEGTLVCPSICPHPDGTCACVGGFVRDSSTNQCVSDSTCTSNSQFILCDGSSEEYRDCGPGVTDTCNGRGGRCDSECVGGCFCKPGYVQDVMSSRCILRENCPSGTLVGRLANAGCIEPSQMCLYIDCPNDAPVCAEVRGLAECRVGGAVGPPCNITTCGEDYVCTEKRPGIGACSSI